MLAGADLVYVVPHFVSCVTAAFSLESSESYKATSHVETLKSLVIRVHSRAWFFCLVFHREQTVS